MIISFKAYLYILGFCHQLSLKQIIVSAKEITFLSDCPIFRIEQHYLFELFTQIILTFSFKQKSVENPQKLNTCRLIVKEN